MIIILIIIIIISSSMGVHAFSKGINLKVNIIAWLGFDLTYYIVTIQFVSHYATCSPPPPETIWEVAEKL